MGLKAGPYDISHEEYREYEFAERRYRIPYPLKLWIGTTTHRVLDYRGIVHCVPSVGFHGCLIRWKPKVGQDPVAF